MQPTNIYTTTCSAGCALIRKLQKKLDKNHDIFYEICYEEGDDRRVSAAGNRSNHKPSMIQERAATAMDSGRQTHAV